MYCLPTEAEWEYACRAGSTTRWSCGDDEMAFPQHAWFAENSGSTTHPVGLKMANRWGLYYMHGNVREWCAEWFDETYYANSPREDPTGACSRAIPCVARWRVEHRRHSWDGFAAASAFPCARYRGYGFRVVLLLPA